MNPFLKLFLYILSGGAALGVVLMLWIVAFTVANWIAENWEVLPRYLRTRRKAIQKELLRDVIEYIEACPGERIAGGIPGIERTLISRDRVVSYLTSRLSL